MTHQRIHRALMEAVRQIGAGETEEALKRAIKKIAAPEAGGAAPPSPKD